MLSSSYTFRALFTEFRFGKNHGKLYGNDTRMNMGRFPKKCRDFNGYMVKYTFAGYKL